MLDIMFKHLTTDDKNVLVAIYVISTIIIPGIVMSTLRLVFYCKIKYARQNKRKSKTATNDNEADNDD